MRPGISVRPLQSITSALGALIAFAETSRTVSPSTSTDMPPCTASAYGSRSFAFLNRICAIAKDLPRRSGAVAASADDDAMAV